MTSFPAKAHVLTSLHADGELMTRVCLNLGIKVIRGSSTRRVGRAARPDPP